MMPRTKGSKNRPKTNTDYATQITEKQSEITTLRRKFVEAIPNPVAADEPFTLAQQGRNYCDQLFSTPLMSPSILHRL